MRVEKSLREPSDSAALSDGDFVKVILVPGAVFLARVIEATDQYLRVVMHSMEKGGQMLPLWEQSTGDCLAIDTVFPWFNIGLVMHEPVAPHQCSCLEA